MELGDLLEEVGEQILAADAVARQRRRWCDAAGALTGRDHALIALFPRGNVLVEVEGMAAMTMPFPVDSAVNLTGFAAGDPVRFELRVDWEAARPVVVTAMEKLPADTELALD